MRRGYAIVAQLSAAKTACGTCGPAHKAGSGQGRDPRAYRAPAATPAPADTSAHLTGSLHVLLQRGADAFAGAPSTLRPSRRQSPFDPPVWLRLSAACRDQSSALPSRVDFERG